MSALQWWTFLHTLIGRTGCVTIVTADWVQHMHKTVVYGGSCMQAYWLAAQSHGQWAWSWFAR